VTAQVPSKAVTADSAFAKAAMAPKTEKTISREVFIVLEHLGGSFDPDLIMLAPKQFIFICEA
jgi:hypothetical protein